jgi:hypothetical protein
VSDKPPKPGLFWRVFNAIFGLIARIAVWWEKRG